MIMEKETLQNTAPDVEKKIDDEILRLLSEREKIVMNAGASGSSGSTEEERRRAAEKYGLSQHMVSGLFRLIAENDASLRQYSLFRRASEGKSEIPASFLGPMGTYSSEALVMMEEKCAVKFSPVSCSSFREIVDNVESGITAAGFLPMENSNSGSINDVLDLLRTGKVMITGEVHVPINHSLLVTEGADESTITDIYSHYQPFEQCSRYLAARLPKARHHFCSSTAAAMEEVAKLGSPHAAALGGERGGRFYGLHAAARSLANNPNNITRFLMIGPSEVRVPAGVQAKTTMIFTIDNVPGALVKVLLALSERRINMIKLQSRPIPERPFEEFFYVDMMADINSAAMQEALGEIRKLTLDYKVLGSYPADVE